MKRGSKKLFSSIEIFILIISIIAVSYTIGSEFKIVRADYNIQSGDNLWDLVKKDLGNGATNTQILARVNKIKKLNTDIKKWDNLQVGQVIKTSAETAETKEVTEAILSNEQIGGINPEINKENSLGYDISQIFQGKENSQDTPTTNPTRGFFDFGENNWDDLEGGTIEVKGIGDLKSVNHNGKTYFVKDDGTTYDYNPRDKKITKADADTTREINNEFGLAESLMNTKYTKYNFWTSLGHATSALALAHVFTSIAGFDSEQTKAIDAAVFTGIMTGEFVASKLGQGYGFIAGIVVAALILYATYEDTKSYTYTFTCNPWTAPPGGKNCELCNSQEFPCSEYQCMSLGQACELINIGTGEEKCTWSDPYDSSPPIISTFDDALLNDKYEYSPDGAISPPDRGIIVEYTETQDNCVPPFTPFSFGIQLDEPGKCKIDYERKQTYDEMSYNFGGSALFRYNHTNIMSLPSPSSLENENITLENGGVFNIYVKCQDPNGNYNVNDFVFRFCVDDSPDTTPPIIEVTNPTNGAPIRNNQTQIETTIYLNEPSTCKWSHSSQKYDQMTNQMTCATSAMQMNAQMLYEGWLQILIVSFLCFLTVCRFQKMQRFEQPQQTQQFYRAHSWCFVNGR